MDLHYLSSTPNSPHNLFWHRWLQGDQTVFPVKCRHCGSYFPLEWIYPKNRDRVAKAFYGKTPADYCSVKWPQKMMALVQRFRIRLAARLPSSTRGHCQNASAGNST